MIIARYLIYTLKSIFEMSTIHLENQHASRSRVMQTQKEDKIGFDISEEISIYRKTEYKRIKILRVNPIHSESSQQDQETFIREDCQNQLNKDGTPHLGKMAKKNKNIIKPDKIKNRTKKSFSIASKSYFQNEQINWDKPLNWGLPEECLKINREHKECYYNEVYDSILACLSCKSQIRTIFLSGEKESAKKVILFEIIKQFKQQFKSVKQFFLNFQDEIGNDLSKKRRYFCSFLENNITVSQKMPPSNQNNNSNIAENDKEQKQVRKQIKNILVIGSYGSLIWTFKECNKLKQIKELLRHNTSNLIIFIDCKIYKKQIETITDQGYFHISMPNNSKVYFMESILAAVNNYPFQNQHWELTRPLANFFTSKMEENNKLRLSIIRKYILFLENYPIESKTIGEKQRVNRQIIQKFMQRFIDRTIRIDLRKLTIHQKAVLTSCYLILKQNDQILISIQKLHKKYIWICQSISLKFKMFKEFTEEVIFQLSIYKLIKVEKARKMGGDAGIMLNTDFDLVRYSLQQEIGFSKFYCLQEQ